ncbi:MAG: hypothetical protein DI551_02665 [Micavibrio aeruginosavorus]|uniref:Uncharacterized protein n=1 Tax=Micavibrio aeruginosavorus TaxID=349221 RepID=A0A2W5N457_9BACT|nr:MAG: hypothetical protein DI551_02665 [Micavibrio aeruginosavorus]
MCGSIFLDVNYGPEASKKIGFEHLPNLGRIFAEHKNVRLFNDGPFQVTVAVHSEDEVKEIESFVKERGLKCDMSLGME